MITAIRNGVTVVLTPQEIEVLQAQQTPVVEAIPLATQLATFFAALPVAARAAFLPVMGGFKAALELPEPDLEAILFSANALEVTPDLVAAKASLLALLGGD